MSREIKFRSWIGNTMVFWGFVDGIFISPPASLGSGQNAFNVPQMQFTGILDSKGKEIYEGDILKWKDTSGEYKWIDEHACFALEVNDMVNGKYSYPQKIDENYLEVVGNIYENSDLLK